MSASFSVSILLLSALLLGCTSDESGRNTAYDDIVLTEEEQAEMDAFLDSARTAATDEALARTGRAYGGQPADGEPPVAEAPPPDATAGAERAWPEPEALRYRRYQNEAYSYGFEYPDNLFHPDEPIGGDRGQAYQTADGSAVLLVFATDGGSNALGREYEAELKRFDQEVSYQVLRPNWFVVSGYEGPYVFYQRTHRSVDGGLRTLRLRHLARDKDYFGPITERLSHSFEG